MTGGGIKVFVLSKKEYLCRERKSMIIMYLLKHNLARLLTVALLTAAASLSAQKVVLNGQVFDAVTGAPLAMALVTDSLEGVTVVTNDNGVFSLKIESLPATLKVSYLGYQKAIVEIPAKPPQKLHISLMPANIVLKDVIVWMGDPRSLVEAAIASIPDNYENRPSLSHAFYRETAMKRQHYVYVAEGLVDMYKTAYYRGVIGRDRAAIVKGRRLLSRRNGDTLSLKVTGGPLQAIQLDLVKNIDFLLNSKELDNYGMRMGGPAMIGDRPQFVVEFFPSASLEYALYHGRFYIDCESLAFTRIEMSLDMGDAGKATRNMLVRKPAGVRFKPRELSCLVQYKEDQGKMYLSYVRNTLRFNCDWKRRLFSTSFTAVCEMAVTSRQTEGAVPLTGHDSFDAKDAFYDSVEYFKDPEFWEDYNIIEPTESLDKAIDKLIRLAEKQK